MLNVIFRKAKPDSITENRKTDPIFSLATIISTIYFPLHLFNLKRVYLTGCKVFTKSFNVQDAKNLIVQSKRGRIEKNIRSGSGKFKKINIRIQEWDPKTGIKKTNTQPGTKKSKSGLATRHKTKQRNITHYTTRRIINSSTKLCYLRAILDLGFEI